MKLKSIKKHLCNLIKDGHMWQYTDNRGLGNKPKLFFSGIQWAFIIISGIIVYFTESGFDKNFIGYVIASLSIFTGLFLTLILSVFDKFTKMKFETNGLTEKEKIKLTKLKNFMKKFTALTSYSILISISTIFLLSLSLLISELNINIFEYSFSNSIGLIEMLNFSAVLIIVMYRLVVLYFFFDFLLMVLYALSSLYNYISFEFDKVRIMS